MPNTQPGFNPAYSTISFINLGGLNIILQNTECIFERLELVENVNDIFPSGVIIVKDFKDIVTRIKENKIDTVQIGFSDRAEVWDLDITSVSYINNAASDSDDTLVGIYVSNKYYKKTQTTSLNAILHSDKPKVERITDFISNITAQIGGIKGIIDETSNYVLYRPINTIDERQESVSDNSIEYLNYLSTYATDLVYNTPNFMFWTNFDGTINFKHFYNNLQDDPEFGNIDGNVRRIAVYNGDSVIQKLSDGKVYRKAYYYGTNPAYQYIAKNYYYVNKIPKIVDIIPSGLTGDNLKSYIYGSLAYQFQDEGQKYNVEAYSNIGGTFGILPGSDQIFYNHKWGYFDGGDSINDASYHTHIGQDFGTFQKYASIDFMGHSGYFPYVDNTEMWKNMFDITAVHPDFPNSGTPVGSATNLQKVINIRYANLIGSSGSQEDRLQELRKIELQNFISYVLCCMGDPNQDDCFFAVLQRAEIDNTKGFTNTSRFMYRYKWTKIDFDAPKGSCGPSGACGACGGCGGGTLSFHQLENWGLDSFGSSSFQDETWAINLNERGLTGGKHMSCQICCWKSQAQPKMNWHLWSNLTARQGEICIR